jgi:tRNA pseudouridine38-40 synthase
MRIALKFAYDGTRFHGYARQPNVRTVEGELLTILQEQGFIIDVKNACVRTASRTDKGVSALGNVIAFNIDNDIKILPRQLFEETEDIFVYGFKQVESGFYPRYAQQRIYRYYLKKDTLDTETLLSTASVFTGEHNFSNFARVEPFKNPLRTIDMIICIEEKDFFILDFYAQTFLWNQVRRVVSALEKVARGKFKQRQIIDALSFPEKKMDFGLAPAEPLLLKNVIYNFQFKYEKKSLPRLRRLEQRVVSSLK